MFEALIEAGLVKQKRYDNGLSVFKYSEEAGEFLDAYREELLAKNLLSYHYDW